MQSIYSFRVRTLAASEACARRFIPPRRVCCRLWPWLAMAGGGWKASTGRSWSKVIVTHGSSVHDIESVLAPNKRVSYGRCEDLRCLSCFPLSKGFQFRGCCQQLLGVDKPATLAACCVRINCLPTTKGLELDLVLPGSALPVRH